MLLGLIALGAAGGNHLRGNGPSGEGVASVHFSDGALPDEQRSGWSARPSHPR